MVPSGATNQRNGPLWVYCTSKSARQHCWIQHGKVISDMNKSQDFIGQPYVVCWLLFHKVLVYKLLTWKHKACEELECTVARSRATWIALPFKSFFSLWSLWSSILWSPQPNSESSKCEVHQFKILVCSSLENKAGALHNWLSYRQQIMQCFLFRLSAMNLRAGILWELRKTQAW